MARAKEKPLYTHPTDYEDDFHAWSHEQAELVRLGRFGEADLPNIIEELETLGRSERKSLISAYRLVLMHMLKWQLQPSHRTGSWRSTIRSQRRAVARGEKANPSLKAIALELIKEAYEEAREDASDETDLPLDTFPAVCPWTLDQIRDPEFLPD